MYDTPVGHAVRDCLQAVAEAPSRLSESGLEALRTRVCAAVLELKARDYPIERIIIRLKDLAAEVGLPHRSDGTVPDRDAVVALLLRWSIDAYYGPTERS